MNSSRLWVLGGVILSIAILAGGYFLGVTPALAQAAIATDQTTAVEAQNTVQAAVLATLRKQAETIEKSKDELTAIQEELPPGARYSDFIGQINGYAAATGATVTSISTSDAALLIVQGDPSATPDASTPDEGGTPAADPSADPDGSGPLTPSAAPTGQETGLIAIPVTITIKGTDEVVFNFLEAVRMGSRIFLIQDLASSDAQGDFEASISGIIYVLPDSMPIAEDAVTQG